MREGHGGEDEEYVLDKKLIGRRQWRRDQADGEIRNIKPRSGLDRYRPTRGITAWGEKGPAEGDKNSEFFGFGISGVGTGGVAGGMQWSGNWVRVKCVEEDVRTADGYWIKVTARKKMLGQRM